MLKSLPSTLGQRLISIRSVKATARTAVFQQELQRITGGATSSSASAIEPLFHGTPERWRATAVAMNGFDLSITLVGRAFGNGVYSSPNPSTALGYSGGTGSLLLMRGIVATGCRDSRDNTTIAMEGDFYVFPNPKAVLPLLIADFAESDAKDAVTLGRQEAEGNVSKIKERRKKLVEEVKIKEREFLLEMAKRLRGALGVYNNELCDFAAEAEAAKRGHSSTTATSPAGASLDATRVQSAGSLLRRALTAKAHFLQCLPLYEAKPKVVKALQRKQVVILMAETGSGKSTQLPQILLDSVLPAGETRRIAVLEPRRVNAIALCQRVSVERGTPPGGEVGYSLGRGESKATEGTTCIEFMTHGLFVQVAKDPVQLLERYCAVIVDEAHERSVDVDLSLTFIKWPGAVRPARPLR